MNIGKQARNASSPAISCLCAAPPGVEPLPVDEAGAGAPVVGHALVAERPAVAAMTPEDAASNLERGSDPFLLFRHAATAQVNLVYRRADGTVGWIAPTP